MRSACFGFTAHSRPVFTGQKGFVMSKISRFLGKTRFFQETGGLIGRPGPYRQASLLLGIFIAFVLHKNPLFPLPETFGGFLVTSSSRASASSSVILGIDFSFWLLSRPGEYFGPAYPGRRRLRFHAGAEKNEDTRQADWTKPPDMSNYRGVGVVEPLAFAWEFARTKGPRRIRFTL
jgi:hypothetical protein